MCPTPASNKIGKGPAQIQTTRSSKIETCILKCPIPDLDFERLLDELKLQDPIKYPGDIKQQHLVVQEDLCVWTRRSRFRVEVISSPNLCGASKMNHKDKEDQIYVLPKKWIAKWSFKNS